MPVRLASHAGSWYAANKDDLSHQLDGWLAAVPKTTNGIRPSSESDLIDIPCSGARAIIAPHAGYSYSGPAAAWAYQALDLSRAKRVFLLGPSHHLCFPTCALSRCEAYDTPFGSLQIDMDTIKELRERIQFDTLSKECDESEHSLEMHLPYIYKMFSRQVGSRVDNGSRLMVWHLRQFSSPSEFPLLVPILVGNTSDETERRYGRVLARYLDDPYSVFIISSDFCHWGARFHYTYYQKALGEVRHLKRSDKAPSSPLIYESIANVDGYCMDAVESRSRQKFTNVIKETGNTVCGRHPIGVMMAAVEMSSLGKEQGKFRFIRYERSSDCTSPKDSSVSYCSALAVL